MHYLTFALVTDLEQEIFKKCSFDQPPMSHLSPIQGSDKPSAGSKSTYSNTTHWLQQSKSNINHFWKEDTAHVKALKQYHFASNVLKGCTQWKSQKSQILHRVMDVINLHMEDSKRCLDYHDSTPMDQTFRHCDPNLHHLKVVTVKAVTHFTIITMLDENHMHYSNVFGNIFKETTLCKKQFPDGPQGIMMSKGRAAHAIICHFCPYTCLNDDYTYHHLATIHLNIQWGCMICFDFSNGYLSKIREHVVPSEKELQGVIPLITQKDEDKASGISLGWHLK